ASIALGDSANYTFISGVPVTVSSPSLTFGAGSALTASGASNVTINNGNGTALTIYAPDNNSATVSSAGGTININNTSSGTLTFAAVSAGNATLNFNGVPLNLTTSNPLTINSTVTVSS